MSQVPHRETVWIQADDGLMLAVRRWRSANRPILICPGRAEAAIKYDDFAFDLVNHGFSPWIVDWRGQGASGRQRGGRGWVASFEDYLSDFQRIVERIAMDHAQAPLVFGHSMGGHLALRMAVRVPFAGLCLTSPMVDLHLPVARGLARAVLTPVATSWLGDRRLGRDRAADRFEGNPLTSDRRRFETYRQMLRQSPQLDTGPPTLQWLRQALISIDAMWNEVPKIEAPTIIFGALNDPIVPVESMEKCAARLPKGRYVPLRGRHELLQESDEIRAALWAALTQFWVGL